MSEAHLSGTIAGRYEIVNRLGAGGMGEVYRARDTKLQRDVAIKRLAPQLAIDPRYRERLLREARAAARVSHQGLAALYDVLEEGDDLFLVMEHVEGRTLRDAIADDDLDTNEALKLLIECSAALAAAHKSRIVHRDITPANIMVTLEGRAKILDFGLAHAAVAADPDGSTLSYLEGDSGVAGTPPYMAPEVLLGKKTDYRADIFSLGVVAYQLLTTKNPFFASTPTAVSDRILHMDPPPIVQVNPAVPPQLEPIVRKMLAKDPEHRYATMDDVQVDLRNVRRLLRTSPSLTGTYPSGISVPATTAPRWSAALMAAAVVIVGGFLAWAYWPDGTPAPPVAVVAAADNMMLAVLPLHDAADSVEDVALADGLGSTLAAKLGPLTREHEFQLVPSVSLRSRGVETVEGARLEFGCDRVLTVVLRREGDRLQANLGLMDTHLGTQIDGAQVDGSIAAIFDFEATVADRVLRMLRLELRPTDMPAFETGTTSVGAREFYLSGVGYQEQAEDEEGLRLALGQFRQALRADPGFAKAHAALGNAYLSMFSYTREDSWLNLGIEECRAAVELDDLGAGGHSCQGRYEATVGNYESAIDAYRRARTLAPTDDSVVGRLASALRSANRPEEAEQTYLDAIELRPHYASNHDRLGGFYQRVGRKDDAIRAYERASQLAPGSWRIHNNLGTAYYYAGDRSNAIRAWRDAVALNVNYATGYSNLGTVTFYQGDYAESAKMFERATELRPNTLDFWGNLGDARWFSGDPVAARDAFTRAVQLADAALRINVNDAETQSQAGYYKAMLGDSPSALLHAERALALEPDSPRVLRKIAQTYALLGPDDRAIDYLRQAIEAGYTTDEVLADPVFRPLLEQESVRALLDQHR